MKNDKWTENRAADKRHLLAHTQHLPPRRVAYNVRYKVSNKNFEKWNFINVQIYSIQVLSPSLAASSIQHGNSLPLQLPWWLLHYGMYRRDQWKGLQRSDNFFKFKINVGDFDSFWPNRNSVVIPTNATVSVTYTTGGWCVEFLWHHQGGRLVTVRPLRYSQLWCQVFAQCCVSVEKLHTRQWKRAALKLLSSAQQERRSAVW